MKGVDSFKPKTFRMWSVDPRSQGSYSMANTKAEVECDFDFHSRLGMVSMANW